MAYKLHNANDRLHLEHCKICNVPIDYGWHCEKCVIKYRVCQMCDADISNKSDNARTHDGACRRAKAAGEKRKTEKKEASVTYQPASVTYQQPVQQVIMSSDMAIISLLQDIKGLMGEMVNNSRNQSSPQQVIIPTTGNIISSKELAAPNLKDDDLGDLLEVKTAKVDEENNSTYNIAIAMIANTSGRYEDLAPEIYTYGIRTGRIRN